MDGRRTPGLPSDDWMHEQQRRAEAEAQAWRSLRYALGRAPALPPSGAPAAIEPPHTPPPRAENPHRTGSTILKGLVRVCLGGLGAFLGYISATDSGLGEFEVWLATMAGFAVALSLSMFDPFRRMVHMLAETTRWTLILAVCFGGLWFFLHGQG